MSSNRMSSNNASEGGVGFVGLLTLLFIALKLTDVISWSWWWVLSPLLISWAVALVILIAVAAFLILKD